MSAYRYRFTGLLAIGAVTMSLVAASCSKDKAADSAAATDAPVATEATAAAAGAPAAGGAGMNQELHDALPEAIKTNGFMTLATDPTDPPLEFYNDKNELVGSEVDLAAALGVVLGMCTTSYPQPCFCPGNL